MPVSGEAVHRRALEQEGHDLRFVENLRHQFTIFQVVGGERRFVFVKAPVDFIHPVPRIVDGFPFAEQLLRHRFQRERGKIPEGRFERLNAVDNQAAIGLRKKHTVFKTVLAPFQLAVSAPQHQGDAVTFSMFLQHAQIELHHVPADQHIGIAIGKPLVKLFQKLWPAVDILQPEIQRGCVAIRGAKHINNPIPAAFKADTVQLTVASGFDIQRDPFQRRPVGRVGFETGVNKAAVLRGAVDPDGGSNKPLHQKTFWRADIGFVQRHASVAQQFFITHQLAMGAAVKAMYGLTVEIFQFKRRQAPAIFTAQQLLYFLNMIVRDKSHGFLRRQGHMQRAVVRRQPECHLGALRSIPPVSGK